MAMTLDELVRIMPRTLEDVIPRKEIASLRLATTNEVATLPTTVITQSPKMTLRDWYVVAIILEGKLSKMTLFGTDAVQGGTWNGSSLVARDRDRFVTHSGSVYAVVGEPSLEPDLPYICAWLHHLGVGNYLGVAPFFF